MECSAKATGTFLNVSQEDSIFCCLPVDKIGGLMQLVRSEVWQIPLQWVAPASNPLLDYQGKDTITSLTAMQLQHILESEKTTAILNQFRVVLVGGGHISEALELQLQQLEPTFYHTYGMTETCSHIAMRLMGKQRLYSLLPGVEIKLNENKELCIRGCMTDNKWIQTHDIAHIENDSFVILGRSDFIINTGGIKINPESVELEIAKHFGISNQNFVICGIPDAILGEKLVLLLHPNLQKDLFTHFDFLSNKYSKPKMIFIADYFPLTETGKPDRRALEKEAIRKELEQP